MQAKKNWIVHAVCAAAMCMAGLSTASADVFRMGLGLTSLETVPVRDPGNAPDTTTRRGAVAYEYNMGKYEVTAAQYTEFLNAVAAEDTYGLYHPWMDSSMGHNAGCNIQRSGRAGSHTYSVDREWANRPVNFVSWGSAARFANWLHNGQRTGPQSVKTTEDGAYYLNGATSSSELFAVTRQAEAKWAIPSEDEWYKAAYYNPDKGNYYDYPTGSNILPSQDLIDPDPGNNATYAVYIDDYYYTIGSPYWRTKVGAHENSASPYGTFDQGGNVSEWTEATRYDELNNLLGRGCPGSSYGLCTYGMLASSSSENFWPMHSTHFIGFRVAEVPEPGALGLLAVGGLAMIRRRRSA